MRKPVQSGVLTLALHVATSRMWGREMAFLPSGQSGKPPLG